VDANATRTTAAPESRTSSWSLHVATILGIPIRIHLTFLLLLVWFGVAATTRGENPIRAIAFLLLVFACVALHELGHAAMALRVGVRTREIVLYPIGGVARLERIPEGKSELLIALAGPAVNLLIAIVLVVGLQAAGLPVVPRAETILAPGNLVHQILLANVTLFLFNLIPAFPMDGGRVLRATLTLFMPAERATAIAASVGQGIAVLGGAAALFSGNVFLAFIALFVFLGAGQEALFYQQRAVMAGRTAREAMITHFDTLVPQDTLGRASELLLATHQHDFPVVDAWKRVAGVLSKSALIRGLAKDGPNAAVLDVMKREVSSVRPATDLDRVLQAFQADPTTPVLVLEDDALVGMITLENLAEFIQIAQAHRASGEV
jgi:stage IV sporulation protein FB